MAKRHRCPITTPHDAHSHTVKLPFYVHVRKSKGPAIQLWCPGIAAATP